MRPNTMTHEQLRRALLLYEFVRDDLASDFLGCGVGWVFERILQRMVEDVRFIAAEGMHEKVGRSRVLLAWCCNRVREENGEPPLFAGVESSP